MEPGIRVSKEERRLADLIKDKFLTKLEISSLETKLSEIQFKKILEIEPSKPNENAEQRFGINVELQGVDTQVTPSKVSSKHKAEDQLRSNLAKKSRDSSSTSQSSTSQKFYKIFNFIKKQETVTEKIARPELVRVSGFCLDCEGCEPGCGHLDHPRRFVQDLSIHALESDHQKFQTVIFLLTFQGPSMIGECVEQDNCIEGVTEMDI